MSLCLFWGSYVVIYINIYEPPPHKIYFERFQSCNFYNLFVSGSKIKLEYINFYMSQREMSISSSQAFESCFTLMFSCRLIYRAHFALKMISLLEKGNICFEYCRDAHFLYSNFAISEPFYIIYPD